MTLILNVATAVSLMASAPAGPAALTKNPLYQAGALPTVTCTEETYFAEFEAAQRQAENVMTCLEKAWQPLLAKAKIPFKRPKLVIKDGDRVKACGVSGTTYETMGMYCTTNNTVYIWSPKKSRKDELDRPTLLLSVARAYAYHIQEITGIRPAAQKIFDKSSKRGKKDLRLRLEMQTTCFTAAFLSSVWDSLGYTAEDRTSDDLVWVLVNMNHATAFNNGKADNANYWAKRALKTRSPGSCKTFSAPAKRVS
ncbi:neutral zinc metallopeptidase [Herbidospora daliensis]|uniref:neutral zinc metallopeptidase n=1 Tax=Herbidospora daliensis TaxID=295585 RepID=UPI0009FDA52A|nr:neutral zinc metallopeptidase [Herbidospora daliensis]